MASGYLAVGITVLRRSYHSGVMGHIGINRIARRGIPQARAIASPFRFFFSERERSSAAIPSASPHHAPHRRRYHRRQAELLFSPCSSQDGDMGARDAQTSSGLHHDGRRVADAWDAERLHREIELLTSSLQKGDQYWGPAPEGRPASARALISRFSKLACFDCEVTSSGEGEEPHAPKARIISPWRDASESFGLPRSRDAPVMTASGPPGDSMGHGGEPPYGVKTDEIAGIGEHAAMAPMSRCTHLYNSGGTLPAPQSSLPHSQPLVCNSWALSTHHTLFLSPTDKMRTATLASLLLWGGASLTSAKQCSYGDSPEIIAHAGTPIGHEIAYSGCQSFLHCSKSMSLT